MLCVLVLPMMFDASAAAGFEARGISLGDDDAMLTTDPEQPAAQANNPCPVAMPVVHAGPAAAVPLPAGRGAGVVLPLGMLRATSPTCILVVCKLVIC